MTTSLDWDHFRQSVSEYTGTEPGTITTATNLYDDLGMDSLGLFSLGMFLVRTYAITVPIASVAHIETVHDIYTLLKNEGVVSK